MGDTIFTGLFTILGVIIGFGLSQIADYLKEIKIKKQTIGRLKTNLLLLQSSILSLQKEIAKHDEIRTSTDLQRLHWMFKKTDLKNMIKMIIELAAVTIPVDIKKDLINRNALAFGYLETIRIVIEHFNLEFDTIEKNKDPVLTYDQDVKPKFMYLSDEILKNIQLVNEIVDKI